MRNEAAVKSCSANVLHSWSIGLVIVAIASCAAPLRGQSACTSSEPCVLAFGTAGGYPGSGGGGCGGNFIGYFKNRFLASHFDNGTPGDFSDDPIQIGFEAWTNVFGNMANMSDPGSLPSTTNLANALAWAQAANAPFVIHIGNWGCQNNCTGQTSATVAELMEDPNNFMRSPTGGQGFGFYWCDSAYTLTHSLDATVGASGPLGLNYLFERNLRHIARWIYQNIVSVPSARKYLVGVIPSSETHFGDSRWSADYSDVMKSGFRSWAQAQFCPKGTPNCLSLLNSRYGTQFVSISAIVPPTGPCVAPQTPTFCSDWDAYRKAVLREHFIRISSILESEGVPASLQFGHDLWFASEFLTEPFLLPNRNPGLTLYGPDYGAMSLFAGCSSPGPSCRTWAPTEAFFSQNSCNNTTDAECFADDLEHMFSLNAPFMFVMGAGLDGTPLLGSGFEKGIHVWQNRYSNRFSIPTSSLVYSPSTRNIRGCVYDNDSVFMYQFAQPGQPLPPDLNNVEVRVLVNDAIRTTATAAVGAGLPWCGSLNRNIDITLQGTTAADRVVVQARDYPSDEWVSIACSGCSLSDTVAPNGWVDAPASGSVISGTYSVTGWAADPSGVQSITFRLDGNSIGLSGFSRNVHRADVCGSYADPACPYIGWQGALNTTAISNGSHTLQMVVTDIAGNVYTLNRVFQVSNAGDTTAPNGWIDAPAWGSTISGNYPVTGWAADPSGVQSITFKLNGSNVTLAGFARNGHRADVCGTYPDPACPIIGWLGNLNTSSLPNGGHSLQMIVTDNAGNIYTLNRSFQVSN